MTNIEKFVLENLGIELTIHQLELYSLAVAGNLCLIPHDHPNKDIELIRKIVIAYLQEGLSQNE